MKKLLSLTIALIGILATSNMQYAIDVNYTFLKSNHSYTLPIANCLPRSEVYPVAQHIWAYRGQLPIDNCDDAETYYELEEALKEPEKVIKLDIAMQKLISISPEISKLVNLECLDLSFNRISDLPAEFAQLKKLRVLNLTGTRYLPGLPGILKELPNLEIVDLRDHPEWSTARFEEAKKMLPDVKIITDK